MHDYDITGNYQHIPAITAPSAVVPKIVQSPQEACFGLLLITPTKNIIPMLKTCMRDRDIDIIDLLY